MKYLMVLSLVFIGTLTKAQNGVKSIDFNGAIGAKEGTVSGSFVHNWQLGKQKRIEVGLGGRFTTYFGANKYYITAPAKLTSGSTGPFVIFKENITANIDTFLIARPNVFALNALINLGYRVSPRFYAGFNIDLVGFSFGPKRNGNYINGSQGKVTGSSPTTFNALLISDNDFGSLNSEIYGRYRLNDKWSIKSGFQFLFTEYTTDTKVQQLPEENDRFRKKSLMFTAGVTLTLK